MKTVDARGLTCPQPVIMTKKALDESNVNEVITIVDNRTAVENISRLVKTMHCESSVDEKGGEYYIRIIKDENVASIENVEIPNGNTVILITGNMLGKGNDQLGAALMKSFMYTLTQMAESLRTIIFMNGGILLTTEGSEVVEHLKVLEDNGVEILSCGTCLDTYQLTDKLEVGKVSNMYTITEKMINSNKVITL